MTYHISPTILKNKRNTTVIVALKDKQIANLRKQLANLRKPLANLRKQLALAKAWLRAEDNYDPFHQGERRASPKATREAFRASLEAGK